MCSSDLARTRRARLPFQESYRAGRRERCTVFCGRTTYRTCSARLVRRDVRRLCPGACKERRRDAEKSSAQRAAPQAVLNIQSAAAFAARQEKANRRVEHAACRRFCGARLSGGRHTVAGAVCEKKRTGGCTACFFLYGSLSSYKTAPPRQRPSCTQNFCKCGCILRQYFSRENQWKQ